MSVRTQRTFESTHQLQPNGFWDFYHVVSHIPVRHSFRYHARGCRCLRNCEEWNGFGWESASTLPFPYKKPGGSSQLPVSRGQKCRTNRLLYLPYIVSLVHMEDLYYHTFVGIGAFPNAAKPPGARGCSDLRVGLSMGSSAPPVLSSRGPLV